MINKIIPKHFYINASDDIDKITVEVGRLLRNVSRDFDIQRFQFDATGILTVDCYVKNPIEVKKNDK